MCFEYGTLDVMGKTKIPGRGRRKLQILGDVLGRVSGKLPDLML